ncbi:MULTISPECIES: CaiB/BaiF CoA transferase family protein [unclassified Haematobacter]|uniref:CaiB/BaiF CoA transferase family protein n=1 Tax=unclassified Haematobacter TaxID=2640585 RepID=UPI0025BB1257|nr:MULTISPECIES: CoA transferase [unclassified Haematobacter]
MNKLPLPLSGVRILDFSRMLAGPFCTAILADAGADVIKVEGPEGDDARHFAPKVGGESAYFMLINRNKRSLTLDLKSEDDRRVAHELARNSDIVVENFRPGVTRRLGIDYETLSGLNPRLVYASISGFGQEGPLAHRAAYDIIAQAMSGMMSVNGSAGAEPTRVGESLGDLVAGLQAVWSILAALHGRDRDSRGQHLDIAMMDSMFSLMITALSQYLFAGTVPGRIGNAHPISAPLDTFAAEDGHLIIAVANDNLFGRLAATIGQPGLAQDSRFATDGARKANEAELKAIIESWTRERSVESAVAILEAATVPASPILSIDQVVASDHAKARGLVTTAEHVTVGSIPVVTQPVRFLGSVAPVVRAAPALGQHNAEILKELGRSIIADRVETLAIAKR